MNNAQVSRGWLAQPSVLVLRNTRQDGSPFLRNPKCALLATAMLRLKWNGISTNAIRALGDTGAQLNLISEACLRKYRIPTTTCDLVLGVAAGQDSARARLMIHVDVMTVSGNSLFPLTFVVVPRILDTNVPATNIPDINATLPDEISSELADPEYFKSAPIDVLLGAEAWALILKSEVYLHEGTNLVAQRTSLGWLLFGGLFKSSSAAVMSTQGQDLAELAKIMNRFWEMDDLHPPKERSPSEQSCKDLFVQTHKRKASGKYVVRIPVKESLGDLGTTRDVSLQRFRQLERRFGRDPELKVKYAATMSEYITLGHMKKVDRPPIGCVSHIPHHAVTKKFRVVYDASCRSTRNLSLNDTQLVGERLQEDLLDILIRFRNHRYGLTTDIRQMYRCVEIAPEQWDLQRIFWRFEEDQPQRSKNIG